MIHSEYFVQSIGARVYGAANQANISPSDIENIKWNFHDLPTQTRIADILSAYDDAIENNNRRIALLEKAAQELYLERFVRFRFTGHESTRFVNGLPEGWGIERLSKLAKVNPPLYTTENENDEINYIDISSVDSGKLHGYTKYTASEVPSRVG